MTQYLNRRLEEHKLGKNSSTKIFRSWIIIYNESFGSVQKARDKEKNLKSAAVRRWRKNKLMPRGATE